MCYDNNTPYYRLSNMIAFTDPNEAVFDFALISGHPVITDYSLIDREIISNDNNTILGNEKDKIEIKTIDELKEKIAFCILKIIESKKYTYDYMSRTYKSYNDVSSEKVYFSNNGEPINMNSYSAESELKIIVPFLTNQVTFDILYDMYRINSPYLTLNEYCNKYVNYEWDNSIFTIIDSEYPGVTTALYLECFKHVYVKFSKITDESLLKVEGLVKKIRDNKTLQDDCKKFNSIHEQCPNECHKKCKEHFVEYLVCLKTELVKKKDATYSIMISEIEVEDQIMSNPAYRKDCLRLGVDPDLYHQYFRTLNKKGKREEKKPKIVWDYLYYNANSRLITQKQYRRNLKRDSNTSYLKFINIFNDYDNFVETIMPKIDDSDNNYFCKSMDYYHLEIYKRVDFIYKLAVRMENEGLTTINKEHFFVKRFHPIVYWPHKNDDNNCLCDGEKYKYYRPFLFIENIWSVNLQRDDLTNKDAMNALYEIRAKAYELFNYDYKFTSDNYNDISNFIREHYNQLSYHVNDKEWTFMKGGKERYNKTRIENVTMINDSLFGERKSDKSD